MANEEGTVDTVHFRCGESGPLGLDLGYTPEQGPCLLTHVRVTGFDVGIATKGAINSVTAEDITLDGQKTAGWRNESQPVFIRGLHTTGPATAFVNATASAEPATIKVTRTRTAHIATSEGVATLLDCTFTGRRRREGILPAVVNSGKKRPLRPRVENERLQDRRAKRAAAPSKVPPARRSPSGPRIRPSTRGMMRPRIRSGWRSRTPRRSRGTIPPTG